MRISTFLHYIPLLESGGHTWRCLISWSKSWKQEERVCKMTWIIWEKNACILPLPQYTVQLGKNGTSGFCSGFSHLERSTMCIDLFHAGANLEIPFLSEQIWFHIDDKKPSELGVTEVYDILLKNPKGSEPLTELWVISPHNVP
jgi:hypothetical protein